MMKEIEALMEQYRAWLRDRSPLRQVEGWVEITTPYVDRHGDNLQIYVGKNDAGYVLTDDGYILRDLAQSGFNLDSQKRQTLLRLTLNGFGVHQRDGELQVHASPEVFPQRKHNLVQAMLAVNDLFNLAEAQVASLFLEDVAKWFDVNEIRYTPRVSFRGKSNYEHNYDFVIPRSKRQPERLVKAVNNPSKQAAEIVAFSWIDTKDAREQGSQAYVFLNDTQKPLAAGVLDALTSYDLRPIPWSRREHVKEVLAA